MSTVIIESAVKHTTHIQKCSWVMLSDDTLWNYHKVDWTEMVDNKTEKCSMQHYFSLNRSHNVASIPKLKGCYMDIQNMASIQDVHEPTDLLNIGI